VFAFLASGNQPVGRRRFKGLGDELAPNAGGNILPPTPHPPVNFWSCARVCVTQLKAFNTEIANHFIFFSTPVSLGEVWRGMQPTKLISRHKFACDLEREKKQCSGLALIVYLAWRCTRFYSNVLSLCHVNVHLKCTDNSTVRFDCNVRDVSSRQQLPGWTCLFLLSSNSWFHRLICKILQLDPVLVQVNTLRSILRVYFLKDPFLTMNIYRALLLPNLVGILAQMYRLYNSTKCETFYYYVSWVLIYFWSSGTLVSPFCYFYPATCESLGPCRDDDDDDDCLWYLTPCRSVYD
jgi:hypothetical protein